jgi:ribosomal protein S18 acetylase RimI-like enzyme
MMNTSSTEKDGALDSRALSLTSGARADEIHAVALALWERGAPGDVERLTEILEARPSMPPPSFLVGPNDSMFRVAPTEDDVAQAVELVKDEYWTTDATLAALAAALRHSSAWIGARASDGRLVATGRALSDGERHAYIADVAVQKDARGVGLGKALVQLLLSHPMLRRVKRLRLTTRDPEFYVPFGFEREVGRPAVGLVLIRDELRG